MNNSAIEGPNVKKFKELLLRLKVESSQCIITGQHREFIGEQFGDQRLRPTLTSFFSYLLERFVADYNSSVEEMFGALFKPASGLKRPRHDAGERAAAEVLSSVIEKWCLWGSGLK